MSLLLSLSLNELFLICLLHVFENKFDADLFNNIFEFILLILKN